MRDLSQSYMRATLTESVRGRKAGRQTGYNDNCSLCPFTVFNQTFFFSFLFFFFFFSFFFFVAVRHDVNNFES